MCGLATHRLRDGAACLTFLLDLPGTRHLNQDLVAVESLGLSVRHAHQLTRQGTFIIIDGDLQIAETAALFSIFVVFNLGVVTFRKLKRSGFHSVERWLARLLGCPITCMENPARGLDPRD